MALQFDVTTRNNFLTQIVNDAPSGYLIVYSGTPPADVASSLAGTTALVALPLSATIGTVSGGVMTFNAITQTNAAASGTGSFWRIANAAKNTYYVQGTAGTAGANINFTSVDFVSGSPVVVSSLSFTAPGA